jgi:phosphate:Na+ symporter
MKEAGRPSPLQVLSIAALLAALSGCRESGTVPADTIEIVSGTNQTGTPGEDLAEPLVVRVIGSPTVDFLGRRESPRPAAGVPVTFEVDLPKNEPSTREPPPGGDGSPGGARLGSLPAAPSLFARSPGARASTPAPPTPDAADPASPEPAPSAPAPGPASISVVTDAEGIARAWVRLGARGGDWEIAASIARKGERVRFLVTNGVERDSGLLESVVGATVPLRLRLVERSGEGDVPLPDRRIIFDLIATPPGGGAYHLLKDKRNQTDADGWREVSLTLGKVPGVYHVLAEVEPHPGDAPIRGIHFSVVAMDWVFTGFQLATGILVFIIGVRLLGNGFLLLTSPHAHLPTGPWAESRFKGYLGGAVAGSIFESSSLVTSRLTSFANGGLLTAAGALGMVLGASVGGTMLPQLLALGIGSLAAPFLAAGTLLFLLPRRAGLGSWGWVLLGAGLILVGWSLIGQSGDLTALSRQFRTDVLFGQVDYALPVTHYAPRFFAYFLVAAISAFLLRTSNLVVVLAMVLAAKGIITTPTAVPLVLGANIGSAAMVFALSLTKRREARRVALAGFLFQALGGLGAIALSLVPVGGRSLFAWLIEALSPGRFLAIGTDAEGQIAMAHTIYNLLAGLVFLFFPQALLGPVDRIVPSKPAGADIKPFLLDRNLIPVPALALRQATEEVVYLTEVCRKTVAEAFDSFRYNDLDLSEQVVRREEVISNIQRELVQYLAEVCENQLSRVDAIRLEVLHTAANALVRIGALGERLRDLAARKIEEKVGAPEDVDRDLNEAYDLVMAQFGNILSLLRQRDAKTEENAVKMTERLAKFSSRIEGEWRRRLESPEATASPVAIHLQAVIYQDAFGLLFRIAAELAHIAQQMRILAPERL